MTAGIVRPGWSCPCCMAGTQPLREKSARRGRRGSQHRLHSLARRGDILPLQAILGILLLVVIALLIFGLFWVQARRFHASVTDPTVAKESARATFGGVALRTYLATRLDTPVATFLPASVQDVSVGSAPLTMAAALHQLQHDKECLDALKKAGLTYPVANRDDFKKLFQTDVPAGLCRTFFLRTVLFWSSRRTTPSSSTRTTFG